jgi:hypothetical protein
VSGDCRFATDGGRDGELKTALADAEKGTDSLLRNTGAKVSVPFFTVS